jgi:hypothetical protein
MFIIMLITEQHEYEIFSLEKQAQYTYFINISMQIHVISVI